jgi:hypothetical protein
VLHLFMAVLKPEPLSQQQPVSFARHLGYDA